MARVPETDGRTVRNITGLAIDSATNAQDRLERALKALASSLGSTDPVTYLRAHRAAQEDIVEAQTALREVVASLNSIEEICALAAQRGTKDRE